MKAVEALAIGKSLPFSIETWLTANEKLKQKQKKLVG
jgi:hypothetical protein